MQNVPCSAVAVATLCCVVERTNFMIPITASYVLNTCLCVHTHTHTVDDCKVRTSMIH